PGASSTVSPRSAFPPAPRPPSWRSMRWSPPLGTAWMSASRTSPPGRSASPSTCRASCARRARPEPSGSLIRGPRAMAVYTEVSDDDLAHFIAGYDLGTLLSYKGIAEGVENTNYLVHTEKGP